MYNIIVDVAVDALLLSPTSIQPTYVPFKPSVKAVMCNIDISRVLSSSEDLENINVAEFVLTTT